MSKSIYDGIYHKNKITDYSSNYGTTVSHRYLTDEETLDKIDIKIIEKYLRNKKLKNINK